VLCLDKGWLNKMELLPFGPRHIDHNEAYLVVFADNFQTCLLAHGEDWVLVNGAMDIVGSEYEVTEGDE
jgi:hypothetical protein